MGDEDKSTQELCDELQKLIDKYNPKEDGTAQEPTEKDAERMNALTAIIEKRTAEAKKAGEERAARIAAARAAIANGSARIVDTLPFGGSANARGGIGGAYDVTDYSKYESRAWVKDMAKRAGVQLIGGTDLNDQERMALNGLMEQRAEFTHLTSNTGAVVPKELKNKIISLIDGSAVLFGDISKDSFPNQYEIARHKSIKKGDAAKTTEGAAPTDDEQNEFDTITMTGEEIKKTVKMSRKMAVQSVTGFEAWIVSEISARLAVAANAFSHIRLVDETLGMAAANKIDTAKAGTLTKADMTKAFSMLKTFNNPAPKGIIVYANNDTIWNYIAMIENKNGDSYFVDEKTEDPTVQGRIFGKIVKQDDSITDGIIKFGYPDLIKGNIFDGMDVEPYVEHGTQKRCFDGYLLFDCGLAVPQAFGQLTIGTAASNPTTK